MRRSYNRRFCNGVTMTIPAWPRWSLDEKNGSFRQTGSCRWARIDSPSRSSPCATVAPTVSYGQHAYEREIIVQKDFPHLRGANANPRCATMRGRVRERERMKERICVYLYVWELAIFFLPTTMCARIHVWAYPRGAWVWMCVWNFRLRYENRSRCRESRPEMVRFKKVSPMAIHRPRTMRYEPILPTGQCISNHMWVIGTWIPAVCGKKYDYGCSDIGTFTCPINIGSTREKANAQRCDSMIRTIGEIFSASE